MKKELTRVGFDSSAILGSSIRQDTEQSHILSIEKRKDGVVEEIGGSERVFIQIHLGKADIGMGIDCRLLVDFPNALDVSDVAGILTEKKTRMRRFDLAMSFLLLFSLLQCLYLRFGQDAFILTTSPVASTGDWRLAYCGGARYCGYRHR